MKIKPITLDSHEPIEFIVQTSRLAHTKEQADNLKQLGFKFKTDEKRQQGMERCYRKQNLSVTKTFSTMQEIMEFAKIFPIFQIEIKLGTQSKIYIGGDY